jgi:hypothetical protein
MEFTMPIQRANPYSMARKVTQYEELRILTDAKAALLVDNTKLELANADLRKTNERLEKRVKSLLVSVTISLATGASLTVGLMTHVVGATIPVSLSSAVVVFFGVIMASMAILTFVRR